MKICWYTSTPNLWAANAGEPGFSPLVGGGETPTDAIYNLWQRYEELAEDPLSCVVRTGLTRVSHPLAVTGIRKIAYVRWSDPIDDWKDLHLNDKTLECLHESRENILSYRELREYES
jgi:hypothetical protein